MGDQGAAAAAEEAEADSDEDSSDEENEVKKTKKQTGESDSEEEFDEQVEAAKGFDNLNANAMDIPRVDDIPIISKLAKESEKLAQMDGKQQVEYKKNKKLNSVNQVIEAEED